MCNAESVNVTPETGRMVELHNIYVALYASVATVAVVVASVAWIHRAARGARSLTMLMVGVTIWSFSAAMVWLVPTFEQQIFWANAENLGVWMVPVGFLSIAFDMADMHRWQARRRMVLISILSFSLVNMEWLNPGHLFDTAYIPRAVGAHTHYEIVYGPLYWVFIAFAYSLAFVTCLILLRLFLRSTGVERAQARVLFIGGLIPFVASIVTSFDVVPLGYLNLGPIAFLATGPLWLAAILSGTLLDVLPIARHTLVEQMADGVVVVDAANRVVDANPSARAMLRIGPSNVLGTSAQELLTAVSGADTLLEGSGPRRAVLQLGPLADFRYADIAITPLVVGPGRPPGQLVTLHDVTEERAATERLREAQDRLQYDATHDALTGLPNRVLLDDRLEHALAHAKRNGSAVAVLFIDLDDFKDINDTLGHAQGDLVLVEVANRIEPVLRESDTVGRFGGDEFVIVLTGIADAAHAELAVRRILKAMAPPYRLGTAELHVAASIGVALFPADGEDASTLMQHADIAMYGAKQAGHNQTRFFSDEFQEGLDRRAAVEMELIGAHEADRYFLLYQPQVDLTSGQITGAEALVRLRSRDGSILAPDQFIHVAENSELILQLGDWVLHRACADLAAFHEVAPDLIMSVNFSARQFRDIDVASLQDVLATSGLEAQSLAIELTETTLMTDPHRTAMGLDDLRGVAGLRLSLDGFGTGYSSMSYVRMFRADTIKIDRSFVGLLPDDQDARAVVLSTIALARSLHSTVIAEGPETEAQVRFLRASGCDCAQGFYFSRPIPADELTALLRRGPFTLPGV